LQILSQDLSTKSVEKIAGRRDLAQENKQYRDSTCG